MQKQIQDFETKNVIDTRSAKNSKPFVVEQRADGNTVQYRNSFFIKTVIDWNHLEEETVSTSTVEGFRIALQHSD